MDKCQICAETIEDGTEWLAMSFVDDVYEDEYYHVNCWTREDTNDSPPIGSEHIDGQWYNGKQLNKMMFGVNK